MPMPFRKVPSRPDSAHIKLGENPSVEATGFEFTRHAENKFLKARRRMQIMQNFTQKAPKSPGDPIFTHFQKEADKKEDANCIFLLWGSNDSEISTTWAVDIPITDLESEDQIFQRLAEQYATELGFLRKYLSFRKFSKLKPVAFRLICQSSGRFLVSMEPLNLAKYRQLYSEQKEKVWKNIESITDLDSIDDQDYCYRDHSGSYKHYNSKCPTHCSPTLNSSLCPFMEWDTCNDQLRWIETTSFLSYYFRNPAGARFQNILDGFAGHRFIHRYESIRLPLNELNPQNRFQEFHGLYVQTIWSISRCIWVFASLLICTVAGGKLIWNSWEIVFGAGSFIVALPMLALTAMSYYEA